jgi:chromosome partitioning protein
MMTVALAGSERGSGKTMLTYHLSHMLVEMGFRVLAVDLDPQPDLTAGFLAADAIAALWHRPGGTIWEGIRRAGGTEPVIPVPTRQTLALLPGDPALDGFDGTPAQTDALRRNIADTGHQMGADIALIDLGPGLGPINRSALAVADKVVLALTADPFSVRGLSSLGPRLRALRGGTIDHIGYIITTQESVESVAERAFLERLDMIPAAYATYVAGLDDPHGKNFEIGRLRDFRSLEPLARSGRKPMFDISPADGAVGATANFVRRCRDDFAELTRAFVTRTGLPG